MKREGYLLIDHTASPGISKEEYEKLLRLGHRLPYVPEGTSLELGTKSCAHCGGVVVLNPGRTRERGHCRKCDKFTCDACTAIGDCRPIQALITLALKSFIEWRLRDSSVNILPEPDKSVSR